MSGVAVLRDLCLDAQDPQHVGAFWGAVLGREPQDAGQGDGRTPDVVLEPTADSPGPRVHVLGVPEPKTSKTRVHLDVTLHDGHTVEDLLALGGSVVTEPGAVRWWVLADPEGTEFCAFLPEDDPLPAEAERAAGDAGSAP